MGWDGEHPTHETTGSLKRPCEHRNPRSERETKEDDETDGCRHPTSQRSIKETFDLPR